MTIFLNDRELLERFREGDRAALETVYRTYAPALATFLRKGFSFSSRGTDFYFRGYREPFDLDNALQETFVKGFQPRARKAYDGINPYRNYLFTIARNLVMSEFRRKETAMSQLFARGSVQGDEALEGRQMFDGPKADLERDYLIRELIGLYSRFIGELSTHDQVFFRARFEEGNTRAAVSEQTGLSAMQVRTREAQLKRRFLSFMQTRGYLEEYGTDRLALSSLGNF